MRTNLLPAAKSTLMWLERDVPGQAPERIELDQFPFTVGRNESCDYQILSSRVSREHAEFVREAGAIRLRDLKSTNGTLVNGKRIDEHRLVDGDLVVIADVHFSFRTTAAEAARVTVTQVMEKAASEDGEDNPAGDLVFAVRRMHETLLHRATRNRFQPVYDLTENRCVGYEAVPRPQSPGEPSSAQQLLEATDCRLTERICQLHRLIAAEHVAKLSSATLLFVNLQPAEVGADLLPESLARLQRRSPVAKRSSPRFPTAQLSIFRTSVTSALASATCRSGSRSMASPGRRTRSKPKPNLRPTISSSPRRSPAASTRARSVSSR